MKVMCIKPDTFKRDTGEVIKELFLIVGEEYTIDEIIEHPDYGVYYWLKESKSFDVFHSSLFAVISDIDELELVSEKELIECR